MHVAVIGCGDWGKNIARTLKGLSALAGICDHHASKKAQEAVQALDVPFLDLESLLEDPSIQGVVVSTQTASHFSLAKQALEKGKHVFVEKPLVPSMEEAQTLAALAEEKGCVLMVGHLLRYHRAFETMSQWVEEEKIGSLLHLNTSRKNLGKIYPNESVIWDLAPHDLSMVLALKGEMPKRVSATTGHYAIPVHADEAMVSLEFSGGHKAFITLSRLSPFKEQKVTAVGTNGMIVFDDTLPWDRKLTFYGSRVEQKSLEQFDILRDSEGMAEPLEPSEPLRTEMAHFIHSMKEGSVPRTPAQEAMNILKIIRAAHESAKRGEWVSLEY